jgi:DNA-binding response OmpR family regulator
MVTEGKAEGITINRELDPALTAVDFDKAKCETIMVNILMNAMKHSSKGDTITIKSQLTGNGMVHVSTSDQGLGLRDIDPSQMFTSFYQSNSEQYGSGIGLSYSKILVELHGGSIGAFDNPDRGATFWWEIPAVASAFVSAIPSRAYLNEIMGYGEMEAVTPEEEYFSTAGMSLMLVDDNQDLLEFLREALSSEFAEILTATGGKKVMSMLAEGYVPDIIVSDINMPEGDGYTLCKTLKNSERYSHIPVVLLTSRGEERSQSDSYRIGAEGYMPKPFEVETLLELLRSIMRRKAEIRKKYLDTNKEDAAGFTAKAEDFILRLNKLIGENISNPDLDQQFICRELGVSRALLYNRMKAVTGAGAKEYITKIRLEKAKSLIESTDLTIAEISEMTGFSTQSYFSTAFKGYTGKTPSQYKAAART